MEQRDTILYENINFLCIIKQKYKMLNYILELTNHIVIHTETGLVNFSHQIYGKI